MRQPSISRQLSIDAVNYRLNARPVQYRPKVSRRPTVGQVGIWPFDQVDDAIDNVVNVVKWVAIGALVIGGFYLVYKFTKE